MPKASLHMMTSVTYVWGEKTHGKCTVGHAKYQRIAIAIIRPNYDITSCLSKECIPHWHPPCMPPNSKRQWSGVTWYHPCASDTALKCNSGLHPLSKTHICMWVKEQCFLFLIAWMLYGVLLCCLLSCLLCSSLFLGHVYCHAYFILHCLQPE